MCRHRCGEGAEVASGCIAHLRARVRGYLSAQSSRGALALYHLVRRGHSSSRHCLFGLAHAFGWRWLGGFEVRIAGCRNAGAAPSGVYGRGQQEHGTCGYSGESPSGAFEIRRRDAIRCSVESRIFTRRCGGQRFHAAGSRSDWHALGAGSSIDEEAVCAFCPSGQSDTVHGRAECGDDQVCGQCLSRYAHQFYE